MTDHDSGSSSALPRIGIFGGTFDPIHNGHLHIAQGLRDQLDLDQVMWVLAGRPPHKQGQIVSSDEDRLAMLRSVLAQSGRDLVSLVDVQRTGPSYTADTLELLASELGPARFFFLMGEDSLRDFPAWHDPERILRLADLGVAGRPGVETDLAQLQVAVPAMAGKVHLATLDELPISSSEIRQRVAAGLPIDHLTPLPVARYIREHGLYQAPLPAG